MCAIPRCVLPRGRLANFIPTRFSYSTLRSAASPPRDELGIPLEPTWSVNALMSSYPKPSIHPTTLKRLHGLSALIPPVEGTEEHIRLTKQMEDLVKMVEAVKLVDTGIEESTDGTVPDGRIWVEGTGIDLILGEVDDISASNSSGQALLQHAARTSNGLYVVDADRTKR
ncbi:hypothetical protein ABKN59_000312 [Abortiporus biennis]